MELIERYIHEVTRRIAKKNRQDIAMELRSTIDDMLPENYSENEVKEVLQELGDPAQLANQYEDKKQYLIGTEYYDRYISVLKVVALPIVVIIFLSEWIGGMVVSNGEIQVADSMIQTFGSIIITTLNSLAQLFFWITLIFVCIERYVKTKGSFIKSSEWNPETLEMSMKPAEKQIKKREVFWSLFWTMLWTVILLSAGRYIGFHHVSNESHVFYPLFNQDVLMGYAPIIITVAVLSIGLAIYKLVKEEWTNFLVGVNVVDHLLFIALLCFMVSNPNLFNQQFIDYLSNSVGIHPNDWLKIVWGMVGLTILSHIWEVVESWRASQATSK